MIEICALGGYTEVGRNCTAVKIDDIVIILDLGIHLDSYIEYTQDSDICDVSASALMSIGAVPDITKINDWKKDVKAIVIGHAHLDHLGAVPFLANKFSCPVIGTPFTIAVLNSILKNDKKKLKHPIKTLNPNAHYKISKNVEIEFINITHSTPQTVMIAIHTQYGVFLYGNDFKFDSNPVLGKKTDFKRLKEIGNKGVVGLVVDSLYAHEAKKTPSEAIARELLKDVVLGTDSKDNLIIVSTFSSHLARLKSIVEFGKSLGRKIVFLGRSLAKYCEAGAEANIIRFNDVDIIKYAAAIRRYLKTIKHREKYLLVVTGHQGEPKAVLSKMANGIIPFEFYPGDLVIFSCSVIPTELNKSNRQRLEEQLKQFKVRIFKDIHVSGHAAREDHRDLLSMVRPKHIIPAHAELEKRLALKDLALEMGFKNIHIVDDGDFITLD